MALDFSLTDTQEMFLKSARSFIDKEVRPRVKEAEENEAFPLELYNKFYEMGFMGISISEKDGGQGLGYFESLLMAKELSRASVSMMVGWTVQGAMVPTIISKFAAPNQKEKYLQPALKGEKIGALGLTEHQHGNDLRHIETTAYVDGDEWVINGSKAFITMGPVADFFLVLCADNAEKGIKGSRLIFVEKDDPGLMVVKQNKLANRGAETAELFFEDCRVPKDRTFGEGGSAIKDVLNTLNIERLIVCGRGIGVAEQSLELALNYAKEREQFGKPIGEFQSIAFKLAQMKAELESARWLAYRSAWLLDSGSKIEDIIMDVSIAKLICTETAAKIADEALHIHGGWGIIEGVSEAHRFFNDSRVALVTVGSSEIQRRVIARRMGLKCE